MLASTSSPLSEQSCRPRWWIRGWSISGAWTGICMRCSEGICVSLSLALATALLAAQQGEAPHDRAYWQAIAKNHFQVPAGESAAKLAHQLSALLASTDPELRDDLAYSILARWIARGVLPDPELLSLTDEWDA